MNNYLIIPGCDDGNRGDQALVFETKKIAEEAGFCGNFKMLCSKCNTKQSISEGISTLFPILGHPSRKYKNKNNLTYTPLLLLKWGFVAVGDYILSRLIYHSFTRRVIWKALPDKLQQSIRQLQMCDACFVKGGGFIHSYGKITDIYLIYYFLYHIRLAEHFGKKVYVMPNSFGPFITKGVKFQVKKALRHCEVVTVRETLSHNMLKEIGVDSEVYPDLAFNLEKSINLVSEIENIKKIANGRKLVAITARPYRFPNCTDSSKKYESYISALTDFTKWVFSEGYFPVLVEHVISTEDNESDIISLKQIASNLNNSEYIIFSNHSYSCRELKKLYSNMDIVVGTRFHSVIFSLASGIPSIAIAYGGNKSRGIMFDIGLIDYVIDMDKVTSAELIEKFKLILLNEDQIKENLINIQEEANRKRADLINRLKEDTVNV